MTKSDAMRVIEKYLELNRQLLVDFNLTKQEMEVAIRLINGLAYRDLAKLLCITEHTVKFHAGNIYKKCSVRNRQQLCLKLTLMICRSGIR